MLTTDIDLRSLWCRALYGAVLQGARSTAVIDERRVGHVIVEQPSSTEAEANFCLRDISVLQ